jgi:hypothetical protein
MIEPHVQWVTAAPLWGTAMQTSGALQGPALLRFASDTFMQDLSTLLATAPDTLSTYIARPESFRALAAGSADDWHPQLSQLKLYQPAHGHFYLLAAHLVCRAAGLPDKVVDSTRAEKVGFVLRRIGPNNEEMAWAVSPGTATAGRAWQPLTADSNGEYLTLAPDEEVLPMFPLTFCNNGRRRRLLAGLVPTSSRETFQAAQSLSPFVTTLDPKNPVDPRMERLETIVISRLNDLKAPLHDPTGLTQPEIDKIKAERDKAEKEASLFLLLDFADFLSTKLGDLWQALKGRVRPSGAELGRLYDTLGAVVDSSLADTSTWRDALVATLDKRDAIIGELPLDGGSSSLPTYNLRHTPLDPEALRSQLDAVFKVVPATAPAQSGAPGPIPGVPPVPKLDPAAGVQYVLRCVYRRPQCGPFQPDVVSLATERFAIASFFDFDAPARPIRITMPVDTSVAGLRKFNKNVAFIISDKLRQQMNSVTDLKQVLDGNLASGQEFDLGVICSFSIPIITICALIVLLIFINLLNIVFWWLPFVRICFPISLKGK